MANHIYVIKKEGYYQLKKEDYGLRIRREKDWILENQGNDGEIYTNSLTPNGAKEVNPYFACCAAIGLLEGSCENRDYEAVRNYLQWHTNRIIENDGVVTNYIYDVSQGKNVPTENYDSVDSYIALYIELLSKYASKTNDIDSIAGWESAVEICISKIDELMVDGLTTVKPGSKTIYLMDNIEVYNALKCLDSVLKNDLSSHYDSIARGIYDQLWNEEENHFEVGKSGEDGGLLYYNGMNVFYPDAIAQLYINVYDTEIVPKKKLRKIYIDFCDTYKWQGQKVTNFEWPELARIAIAFDDVASAEEYFDYYQNQYMNEEMRFYPYYVGQAGRLISAENKYLDYLYEKTGTSILEDLIDKME